MKSKVMVGVTALVVGAALGAAVVALAIISI